MNDNIRELLEDIARGDGPEHVISNQWLNPDDIPDDDIDTIPLNRAAHAAINAYGAWRVAAKQLQEFAEEYLVATS